MNPILVASVIGGYFLLLILISFFTSRNTTPETFYTANRQSSWYLEVKKEIRISSKK
jgi:hypothetical protein